MARNLIRSLYYGFRPITSVVNAILAHFQQKNSNVYITRNYSVAKYSVYLHFEVFSPIFYEIERIVFDFFGEAL